MKKPPHSHALATVEMGSVDHSPDVSPRWLWALVPWLLHRLCLASTAVAASEGLVLRPVSEGDRAKAVAASVVGSSMLHGRMDLAPHDAVCPSSAE